MTRLFYCPAIFLTLCLSLAGGAVARDGAVAPEIALTPGVASPQLVGTAVTWTAIAAGGPWEYRFSVAKEGGEFRVVRDFRNANYFSRNTLDEGTHRVQVEVRPPGGDTAGLAQASFTYQTRLSGDQAAAFPTANSLVALYCVPPQPAGGFIQAEFRPAGSAEPWQGTEFKTIHPGVSTNFWVAGMRAQTAYEIRFAVWRGTVPTYSASVGFTTGPVPFNDPQFTVAHGATTHTSLRDGVLFLSVHGDNNGLPLPVATDLEGRVTWYYNRINQAGGYGEPMRVVPAGSVLILSSLDGVEGQLLLEVDLAGNTLRETNAPCVSRRLVEMGGDPTGAFHHEALRLPNGHTLVLASVERLMNDVQGASGSVDVLGALVVDLDPDLQPVWFWNAFDWLDVNRAAILGEKCGDQSPGCPPLFLAPLANDWLHANALAYSPADGNLLLSLRSQDWVLKLDYRDGAGSGAVLWKLGLNGDFALSAGVSSPWFSHQHHPTWVDSRRLALFDNGNTRCQGGGPRCHSRGQVLKLNEASRQATLELSVDVDSYSGALGCAQRLHNGNYHFTSGFQMPSQVGDSVEVALDGAGTVDYVQHADASLYRSYRLTSLYAPVYGDLDADGFVTAEDARVLAEFLAGRITWGVGGFTAPYPAADWNGDGRVDAADLLWLRLAWE